MRPSYADAGLDAVSTALELKADYFEALTCKKLLLRTKAKLSADPSIPSKL